VVIYHVVCLYLVTSICLCIGYIRSKFKEEEEKEDYF